KPLANTLEEAQEMVRAAEAAAGRVAMVGFNYRRIPAMVLARQLVAAGTLGRLRQVRAVYLQDWLVDPEFLMAWRLRREQAGSGALGDLGAHIVDLVQYLTGERVTEVSARAATFVKERPTEDGGREPVTVDDAVLFSGSLSSGAIGSFEATRFATGSKNALRVELDGQDGALRFDLERLNELEVYERSQPHAGFRRILVTEPEDPYLSSWWPPGHVLGWEHTFTHQARDLVNGIAAGTPVAPTFADGLGVQRVLAAVEESAGDGGRQTAVAS
ncbi:MAG: Gfo/Idh/MocA family oxidoreductase, partial [Candidatus Dormibacteraeota bacterium]|nr:Gfo/Idh/MocA family oxidoreductase [Candidatus Dormibacteraeota bacterium]